VTGERGEALKLAELKFGEDFAADTAMATKEFQRSLQESGQEAKALAEKRRDEMAARIEQNQQELAQKKLEVLVAPAAELIDLAKAECSDKQDEIDIRGRVTKSEGVIASLIRDLICDNVCNVSTLHGTAPTGFDGPLGQLSLTSDALTLDVGKPAAVLQLGGWLRLRPMATQLTLKNADDLALRVLSAHAGRDSPLQTLSVSGKDKHLGTASAIVIASLIRDTASVTECNLRDNKLGVEGWTIVFNALRDSTTSKIATWDLSFEELGPEIAKPLAEYISVTASLTKIS
jgi:hypothetical protein